MPSLLSNRRPNSARVFSQEFSFSVGDTFGSTKIAFALIFLLVALSIGCSPARWHQTSHTPGAPLAPAKTRPEPVSGPSVFLPTGLPPSDSGVSSQEPVTGATSNKSRFFVVQNIATQKLRVYEGCDRSCGCRHRLILETDMVVGQNRPERRSWLGSYRILRWEKFYQDEAQRYSPWYSGDLSATPGPLSSVASWVNRFENKGAFGWYTAIIGPSSGEQWLHGTWGWGKNDDSARFIEALHHSPLSHSELHTSHGCSRIENRAIALLREILQPGTRIVKIYAREAFGHIPTHSSADFASWPYVLTSENSDEAPPSSRASVEQRRVPRADWLEEGTYRFRTQATLIPLTTAKNPHRNGNIYGIPASSFHGYFLVDEGHVVNYRHPKELKIGGEFAHQESQKSPILPLEILESTHCDQN